MTRQRRSSLMGKISGSSRAWLWFFFNCVSGEVVKRGSM